MAEARPAVAAVLCALAVLAAGSSARADLAKVWALDDGTKIKATDLAHPLEGTNGTFDGKSIRLFGARNEIVAFQVILVGGSAATAAVRPRLDSLGPIQNSGASDDPDNWFVGRRIEIFRQHYFNVTTRSHSLTWTGGAVPQGMSGWVPDALVPLRSSDTVSVPAGRNQGLWIDVYIPKGTPAGVHRGELIIEVGGAACSLPTCRIPVELDVLAATLPDKPTAKTMLYFSGGDNDRDQMMARYFDDPWSASSDDAEKLRARHYKLARRHRVTQFVGLDGQPTAALGERVSGRAFGRTAGYEGPGEGTGQDMYSISTYGGSLTGGEANTWSSWFQQNGPGVEYFLYVRDEPGSGEFSEIDQIAATAKPVPAFVTTGFTSALPNVDIFATHPEHYSLEKAQSGAAAGKRIWIYNGVRPYTGSFATDDVAISTRVNPWIQYKHDIPRWFYWESTYYNDFQGSRGQVDVFQDPLNFTNKFGDEVNGDGLLMYPGRDRVFTSQDQGFDMPLPSIRLKNWRRGIQDVEYLALAKQAGHAATVTALLNQMVPKCTTSQTSGSSQVAWSEDGEVWLTARRQLAPLIATEDGGNTDGGGAATDGGTVPTGSDGGLADANSNALDGGRVLEGCGCSTADSTGLGAAYLLVLLALVARRTCRGRR